MMNLGELAFLAYGGVTAIGALLCYLGARFALLSGWHWAAGVLRLLALWLIAAWMGYGTPVYVALAMFVLGLVWGRLHRRLLPVVLFEVGVAFILAWHSLTPLLPIHLVALLFVDQVVARFSLLRFDKQAEPKLLLNRLVVVVGLISVVALGAHFQRAAITKHLSTHTLRASLDLVPMGAASFWFQSRALPSAGLPDGVRPSAYWQSRLPASGERCLLSMHGAAAEASLQGAAQTIALGARLAGWRVYALDHPGFGASPAPFSAGNIDAWNPGVQTNLLLAEMRREGCLQVGVLGHSQGVTEALRLFVTDVDLAGVWVLGAGLYDDDPESDDYWLNRFHLDRGLNTPAEQLDRQRWELVRDLYYLNQEYCADSPLGQSYRGSTPLHYVTFEREHENLQATRERLWNCLTYPGRERAELDTDHYLDSLRLGGSGRIGQLVFVSQRSPAKIAALLTPATPNNQADNDPQAVEDASKAL